MRQVKDKNLAELLLQLRYMPESKRLEQLNAAEKLCDIVEPDKTYPFDFVYFRITGFHPKESIEHYLISGDALRTDLYAFIAKLSSKSPVPTELQSEQVYSLEELADQCGVSTKTIHRWRGQGLIARKFVFPDGSKRLGFLQSSVERFMENDPERIAKAGQFNRLSTQDKDSIIELARSLAAAHPSRHQVIGKIVSTTGRAHETIRYTLAEYERTYPKNPLFHKPAGALTPHQATLLYEAYLSGAAIPELMKSFHRSRSSIYRIINQRRAAALLARKIAYVPSIEFEDPNLCHHILGEPVEIPSPVTGEFLEPFTMRNEQLLPEYLQILKDTTVLTHEQETKLFRKYNCLKYLALQKRNHITLSHVSSARLKKVEDYLTEAESIERIIVEANLRLVVSIASKHAPTGAHFAELVSKGNYALIQAVQEFDYSTGFRFVKRASLSIAKEYAKVSGKDTEITKTRAASIASRQMQLRETADIAAIERTRQSLTQVIRNELDEREQYIILNHFGLTGSHLRKETKTLKAIGDHLGLTKERVRQIELVALQKLRQCLSSKEFELLTG
ncbi:sigma-70 family RNA polymerase sigma factor [Planctomycetota bacterium]